MAVSCVRHSTTSRGHEAPPRRPRVTTVADENLEVVEAAEGRVPHPDRHQASGPSGVNLDKGVLVVAQLTPGFEPCHRLGRSLGRLTFSSRAAWASTDAQVADLNFAVVQFIPSTPPASGDLPEHSTGQQIIDVPQCRIRRALADCRPLAAGELSVKAVQ